MTQNDVTTEVTAIAALSDASVTRDKVLYTPWIIFASGQGLRDEYGTTASTGISTPLEEEVSALCREFHNALGVQEVAESTPVLLFWKAHQSPQWILTQVLRAPQLPGQRIAYEYFSFALTQNDLTAIGNPLRLSLPIKELREQYTAGLREPIRLSLALNSAVNGTKQASPFAQNGTWPATPENYGALRSYLDSATAPRSFATWWPDANPPQPGVFDIVLRSGETTIARPHEILAIATELNQSLSRNLQAPPSFDAAGSRSYRTLLHDADEVQTMLSEAYLPAALEESPHRWMTRPQKLAGLCQKIADDLPDYAARPSVPFSDETERYCIELAARYGALARDLQKLRHPNMLHQSHTLAPKTPPTLPAPDKSGAKPKNMPIALVLGALLLLILLGLGIKQFVEKSTSQPLTHASTKNAARDRKALAVMRVRAEKEVFRVARTLATARSKSGAGLSKAARQSTVVDAIAQAMLQTPQAQIKPAQKQLLFRMATPQIRAKAAEGVKAGAAKARG